MVQTLTYKSASTAKHLTTYQKERLEANSLNARSQIVELIPADNAGAHICHWEVTKIQGGHQ